MIVSLITSLIRASLVWYVVGLLVLFLGDPDWVEAAYFRLMRYPGVPEFEFGGLATAAHLQWSLLLYWTVPVVLAWLLTLGLSFTIANVWSLLVSRKKAIDLKPSGSFGGVVVPPYSLGSLPRSTTPYLSGRAIVFSGEGLASYKPGALKVPVQGAVRDVVARLTAIERAVCEELVQLLAQHPNHYAGMGHGVGLLEHTLNVVSETASKCTPEFSLPFVAALAHDIGKLITFKEDGKGGWVRKGLHSREGARILATLPAFQKLSDVEQRGLLLAIQYDHAPAKIPQIRGEREATMLAMRIISALSQADRTATAAEKERNLERIQPEDILWADFVAYLRDAPVVQRGKKGAANQVNNPPDSEYVYLYEAPWRDEAVKRLPAEVAAALDLTRRDTGKMAKYTRYLLERLRKEGLLVENHENMAGTSTNPLWDVQSGDGEKALVLRGVIVLRADLLWKKLNYRLAIKSPFPVKILAPNANENGVVNRAPQADRAVAGAPEVTDAMAVSAVEGSLPFDELGLTDKAVATAPRARPKYAAVAAAPSVVGLTSASITTKSKAASVSAPEPEPEPEPEPPVDRQASAVIESAENLPEFESPQSSALLAAMAFVRGTPDELEEKSHVKTSELSGQVEEKSTTKPSALKPQPSAAPLSRGEHQEGIAIADLAACVRYPHLLLGEKYYSDEAPDVISGRQTAGRLFGQSLLPEKDRAARVLVGQPVPGMQPSAQLDFKHSQEPGAIVAPVSLTAAQLTTVKPGVAPHLLAGSAAGGNVGSAQSKTSKPDINVSTPAPQSLAPKGQPTQKPSSTKPSGAPPGFGPSKVFKRKL